MDIHSDYNTDEKILKLIEEMKALYCSRPSPRQSPLEQSFDSSSVKCEADFSETGNTCAKKPETSTEIPIVDEDEDDDCIILDEPTNQLNVSVDYQQTPVPELVARFINPRLYISLIKPNYKKDCRTWLYKNTTAKARVLVIHREVQMMQLLQEIQTEMNQRFLRHMDDMSFP